MKDINDYTGMTRKDFFKLINHGDLEGECPSNFNLLDRTKCFIGKKCTDNYCLKCWKQAIKDIKFKENNTKKMIIESNNQTDLEFGTGDICINSAYYINGEKRKVGLVAFSNQSSRGIGEEGDIKAGQECKVGDFPVIMTFTKKESVDIIIKALQDAKKEMGVEEGKINEPERGFPKTFEEATAIYKEILGDMKKEVER